MQCRSFAAEIRYFFKPFNIILLIVILLFSACKTKKEWRQSELDPLETRRIEIVSDPDVLNKINPINHIGEFSLPEKDKERLRRFYRLNENRLAWFDKKGVSRNVDAFMRTLGLSWKEGLPVDNYHTDMIYQDIGQLKALSEGENIYPALYAHLDILLTTTWFRYANDLRMGKVNPEILGSGWESKAENDDLAEILHDALKHQRVDKSLRELKLATAAYENLSHALMQLIEQKENGGWEIPGNFETLHPGDSSKNVIRLKKFLHATGELRHKDADYISSPYYDRDLERAVSKFQQRHGLKPDGIAGKNTQEQMNHSLEYRIGQVRANLERMRWIPRHEEHYIMVNIPEFFLRYYRNDKLENRMKVVVGKETHHTPILSDTLRYVVFNPTWNVPPSIASEEMVPKIKTDSTFLTRNQFILLQRSYVSGDTVNPDSVTWENITPENFPYFIVQKPGKFSSLGRVKFLFPNNQSIYLHDTPAKHLFSEYSRGYSHGCVRIEEPMEFANQLLDGQMPMDEIQEILESKETTKVELYNKPVVYFVYQTAWVDEYGELNFRDDIYNFDEITLQELGKK